MPETETTRNPTGWPEANDRRRIEGAARQVAAVADAINSLGYINVRPEELAAAQLRLAHPEASLAELGTLADPPLTKDAIAGRLRRLLTRAQGLRREVSADATR